MASNKSKRPVIDQSIAERIVISIVEQFEESVRSLLETKWTPSCVPCESPIESALYLSLVAWVRVRNACNPNHYQFTLVTVYPDNEFNETVNSCANAYENGFVLVIKPQTKVDSFRVDFMLRGMLFEDGKPPLASDVFIIECDGHEFHERTPEQAERDKSRDRCMSRKGFKVVRYTGREIWRDPVLVAEEIVDDVVSNALSHEGTNA